MAEEELEGESLISWGLEFMHHAFMNHFHGALILIFMNHAFMSHACARVHSKPWLGTTLGAMAACANGASRGAVIPPGGAPSASGASMFGWATTRTSASRALAHGNGSSWAAPRPARNRDEALL